MLLHSLRRTRIVFTTTLSILLLGVLSLVPHPYSAQAQVESILTAEHDPTVAVEWMATLYDLIRSETINPPNAARMYAYAGVTVYEAVVPGMPANYSMSGGRSGLPLLPYPETSLEYDWPSVANGALATVIYGLFDVPSSKVEGAVLTKRDELEALRLETVDADVIERSMTLGDEMGALILEWVAADGYADSRGLAYSLPVGEDYYYISTTEGIAPMEPYWDRVRPFGMSYAEVCAVALNAPFDTTPDSSFYLQALEVMTTGDQLNDTQREIAQFWVDTPGITGTPAGHWLMIENQLVEQLDLPLSRAAEMYALVGMAMGDAFISAWSLKYQAMLLRPETYIQRYIRRNWAPFIQSPPFPEYPSGHSVVSGAASEVLTTMFGGVAFTDRTPILAGHGQVQRSFTTFEAAAYEAAISRMYGGIHFRAAIENGVRQGECVGRQILNNVLLRPIPQGAG